MAGALLYGASSGKRNFEPPRCEKSGRTPARSRSRGSKALAHKPSYFDQAAEILERAFKATNLGEQSALLDEALRLHRLAVAEERAKLARIRAWISEPDPQP